MTEKLEARPEPGCPFCGADPYHYVNNGLGMEAVAVNCCELGVVYFQRGDAETVEISRADLDEIANRLRTSSPGPEEVLTAIERDFPDTICCSKEALLFALRHALSHQTAKEG